MTQSATNPYIAGPAPDVSQIEIPADGVQIKAHMARPQGFTSGAAVVVIHENRGLVANIRDVADGLASSGYLAVAPDLLTRDGGTDSIEDIPAMIGAIPKERLSADAQAVIKYLKGLPEVTSVGIMGFCFGGGVTWRVATESADIAAAVPCYGSNPPLEQVPNTKAAVFAVYGATDERINAGIDDINKALDDAGIAHEHKLYAGAGHAFINHNAGERYNAEQAKAAWADILGFFGKHLS